MGPMPENISTFGGEIDSLTTTITWITGVVLVIAEALLIYAIVRFRQRGKSKATYVLGNKWSQVKWVIVPVLAVVVLDFYIDTRTSHAWESIKGSVPKADMTIRITGQQFAWIFTQPGKDKLLGTPDDYTQANELHVPIDTTIVFELEAKDVLHSFWVPTMRLKQDAIPGRTIRGWFRVTKTGTYDIACAEICGVGHTAMRASLIVHTKEEFERDWAAGAQAAPIAGDPRTRGEALVKSKGCVACHSSDGSSRVGPSYKGLFGRKEAVLAAGVEQEITVDEAYIKKSIFEPNAEVVKGFQPVMPSQKGLVSDSEADDIIEYLKEVK